MSTRYQHILSEFSRALFAILPAKYAVIRSFLLLKAEGGQVTPEEIALIKQSQREPVYLDAASVDQLFYPGAEAGAVIELEGFEFKEAQAAAPSNTSRSRAGAIAVLPLTGTISHRMGMMSEMSGGTSTEKFTGWLRAAVKDPSVKAIVIDCDSPGGTVDGVPELGDEIYKARSSKPIVGVANSMSASAAYWLLSQCSEIVVTPSGEVGSIGVFAAHEDISKAADMQGVKVSLVSAGKYKTEGNPFEPLSDDARQALQSQVNDFYDMFTKAVSRGRSTTMATVKAGFGQGRMVMAADAVKEGMADRVATMDQTLSRLGATGGTQKPAAAAEELRILPVAEELAPVPETVAEPDYRIALEQRERELELYR